MLKEGWHWISENFGVISWFVFFALLHIVGLVFWLFHGGVDESQYNDPDNISPADRVRKYHGDSEECTNNKNE